MLRGVRAQRGGSPNPEKGSDPKGGGPKVGGPKFRVFFFPSPAPILALLWGSSRVSLWGLLVSFFLSLGVFSWNCGGVLEAGTLKCARLGKPPDPQRETARCSSPTCGQTVPLGRIGQLATTVVPSLTVIRMVWSFTQKIRSTTGGIAAVKVSRDAMPPQKDVGVSKSGSEKCAWTSKEDETWRDPEGYVSDLEQVWRRVSIFHNGRPTGERDGADWIARSNSHGKQTDNLLTQKLNTRSCCARMSTEHGDASGTRAVGRFTRQSRFTLEKARIAFGMQWMREGTPERNGHTSFRSCVWRVHCKKTT